MDRIAESLKIAFSKTLPGWKAQKVMMNYNRPGPGDLDHLNSNTRKGAVLALLFPNRHQLYVVLTLRHVYQGAHSGQISLPGGKVEKDDATLWETAKRETMEEIGIATKSIRYLGKLTEIYIPPSSFLVTPFVGYLQEMPMFTPDPYEVDLVIESPFSVFVEKDNIFEKKMLLQSGESISVKFFDVGGHVVWGATSMILNELAEIFRRDSIPTSF